MNRAILIVICDFLVSSMLSLMTGMVPAHTGGTGVGLDERTTRLLLAELEVRRQDIERLRNQLRQAAAAKNSDADSAALRRLTAELARNLRQRAELNRRLKATPENTGKLTPEQLKKLLDQETERRIEAELAVRDKSGDVKVAAAKLAELRDRLKDSREELRRREEKLAAAGQSAVETGRMLTKLAGDYARSQQELSQSGSQLKLTERELARAKSAVAAKEADLSGVRDALREMNARIGRVNLERQSLQNTLAFTSGKLNTTERDLADYKDRITRLRRTLAEKMLQLREADRRRVEMGTLVKRTVMELSQAKNELKKSKTAAEIASAKLATTEKLFKEALRGAPDNALKRYAESTVRFDVVVDEERMMLDRTGGGTYYLPLVGYGGKTFVVGAFSTLVGESGFPLLFHRVKRLDYRASVPGAGRPIPVRSPLLVLGGGDGVGAFELTVPGRKPLEPLGIEQLKKRGTQGLYLFRQSAYGGESCALGDRCSLDLAGAPELVIRNAPGAVKAVPGDWVMSREGDFIGVVVAGESSDFGRRRLARVFIPAGGFEKATAIPVVRAAGQKYFARFGAAVRALRQNPAGARGK